MSYDLPPDEDGFPTTVFRSFRGTRTGDAVELSLQIGAPTNPRGRFSGTTRDNALILEGEFAGVPGIPGGQAVRLRFVQ